MIVECSKEEYIKRLYKAATVYFSQPYADRYSIFTCPEVIKWISFNKTIYDRAKSRIE